MPESTLPERRRHVSDLFVVGKTVDLPDGGRLWMQAPNTFERQEAILRAAAVRSRIVLAYTTGEHRQVVLARLAEHGREAMISEIVDGEMELTRLQISQRLQEEEEWREKIEILLRSSEEAATPPSEPELELLDSIRTGFEAAVQERTDEERGHLAEKYGTMNEDDLVDLFAKNVAGTQAAVTAGQEYRLDLVAICTRLCAATGEPDQLDHTPCRGHTERLFADTAEAKLAPDGLYTMLTLAMQELEMTQQDPKGSASPRSSSDGFPSPDAPEESTASGSTANPDAHPGT